MSRIYALSLLFMVGLSGSVQASGGIYKWVDQNGTTQYSQTPPPKNAKNSQTVRVSKHIPADVREGRVRPLSGLDAVTEPNPNNNTAAQQPNPVSVAQEAASTNGQTGAQQSPNTPAANGQDVSTPTPAQSSTVPSTSVPLIKDRSEQL